MVQNRKFQADTTNNSKKKSGFYKTHLKEKDYQNYLDIVDILVVSLDENGIVQMINNPGCKILGYKKSEILGKNWFENFLPERMRKEVFAVFQKLMAGQVKLVEHYENPVLTKKGKEKLLYWHNSILKDRSGKIIGILSSAEDVTEKRDQYAALKQADEFSEAIISTMPDAMDVVDEDMNIIFANDVLKSIFGKNILGKKCFELYKDDKTQCINCPLKTSLNIGETKSIISEGINGGRTFEIKHTGILLPNGKNGILEVFRDITDIKQFENKISMNSDIFVALNSLLNISLNEPDLDTFLAKALNIILSIKWLALEEKGSIFLSDGTDTLIMKAQKNLHPALLEKCAKVKFGYCLCGLAASTKEIVFKSHLDHDHKTRYEGIKPHGHYCIPIILKGRVIGVINVYVKQDHISNDMEKYFFTAFADALAGTIERKKVEFAFKSEKDELEKYNTFMIDRELKMIDLKKEINNLLKKSGEKEKYKTE